MGANVSGKGHGGSLPTGHLFGEGGTAQILNLLLLLLLKRRSRSGVPRPLAEVLLSPGTTMGACRLERGHRLRLLGWLPARWHLLH